MFFAISPLTLYICGGMLSARTLKRAMLAPAVRLH
jgi:hypothetical protein